MFEIYLKNDPEGKKKGGPLIESTWDQMARGTFGLFQPLL